MIILFEVDKVADNVQHLIKWIMDRYTEACKIILCCEDDASILDSVKTRCKFISVDPPVTNEVREFSSSSQYARLSKITDIISLLF